jgi:hypothetical protein
MKAMASRLMVDIYAYSEWKQTIASMSFDGIPMNIGNLHGMTRCSKYLCFAETAWGDQYAYHIDELRKGVPCVYFLDCIRMTPEHRASSFYEFMEKEFIRTAKAPYDSLMRAARGKFGELEVETHLVYIPSVLLGGQDDIEHVQKMNARSAMICNGDIATQVDKWPLGREVRLSCLTKMRPNGCVFGWSGPNHRGLAFLNVTCACCWPCGHQFNRLTWITYPNFPGNNVTYNLRRAQSQCIGNVVQSADLPAEQDAGAAIRAAAKQLSPMTPLAPYVDGLPIIVVRRV